ncbi:MAG: hypothetical protein GQ527_01695, partial [Bacteroidales bacterium]|nr:hypothetical protein [Bacteroidales bacterium]
MILLLLYVKLFLRKIIFSKLKLIQMMKNSKLQIIIAILITTFGFMLQHQVYGQVWFSPTSLDPPTNLTATVEDENDVNLFWTQPSTGSDDWLHWDSGDNADAFGFMMGAEHFAVSAKWDPAQLTNYDTWTIIKMRFFVTSDQPTLTLKIWTGTGPTEIYTQDISTFNVNAWTEIILDTPITIDASTQLWAGLDVDMPSSGMVMGMDAGPGITGYGDMLRYQGTWYTGADLGIDNNWNIQIQVTPGKGMNNTLLGYNIYRNDIQINDNTWTSTAFVDANMLNGTYDYYVTAVYDDGESVPTSTVEVIIDQPTILYADSMALVDLYNNCDGPNWILNDLWLTGPVNEWYGVTTTGTRVTELWRQSNGLTGDIPESIGDLTALEVLHLDGNAINSLPETLGNLAAIEVLWLGWNPIVSIPNSIGNLNTLMVLHIGSMELPLGTLPATFGNMESLEWLALGDAGLNSLPDDFGDLTALETCFLWGNNLTELPESFGGLESLEYLSMYDNQLTTLPDNFGDMENLYKLYMENNDLITLPESFGNLSSLFLLESSYNLLASLPDNFGDLDNLSWLNLMANDLSSLPESFGSLQTLDSVYLNSNQLTSLPNLFGDLSDLNLLSLDHNLITELPDSFGSLATVEQIYLTDNQLSVLPEEFGNMPELFSLVLSQNNLSGLPESICELPSLQSLYAHENQIDNLPENIGD